MTLDRATSESSNSTSNMSDQDPPDSPAGPNERSGRRRRWPWIAALAVLVLAGGAVAVWATVFRTDESEAAPTATAQLVEVTTGTMGDSVSAEGTVAAADTEDLSFSSPGTVTSVAVAAGDAVTAGQVLATIDSSDLEAAVAEAKADVAKAEAKLADDTDADASDEQVAADQSSLVSAQDSLDAAETALEGAQLVASIDGVVTTVDLTVGEQLGSSGTGGTTATGTRSGSGRSSSTLGSGQSSGPQSNASQPQGSTSSTPQIQVVSSGHYTVELAVDSSDISSVETGQSVTLSISTSTSSTSSGFPGFPGGGGMPPGMAQSSTQRGGQGNSESGSQAERSQRSSSQSASDTTATGTVTSVGRVADASSGVATYPVTVTFDADSTKVFVGSTATADINIAQRSGVLQVMSRAVSTNDGRSVVTVALDGKVDGKTEERTVTTGETYNGMVEITSGLKAGDQLVIELPSFPGGGQMGGNGQFPGAGQGDLGQGGPGQFGGGQGGRGQGGGGFTPPGAQGSNGSNQDGASPADSSTSGIGG